MPKAISGSFIVPMPSKTPKCTPPRLRPGRNAALRLLPVLEFDQAGNLVGHWGGPGPGYDWPERNHGITVDYKGNVWIGGADQLTPPHDDMLLKFTHEGKFLMQIGKPLHRD
jgi:hypothetical protein